MSKRLLPMVILSFALLLGPSIALADEMPVDEPTPTPVTESTPAPDAAAAGLGPDSGNAGGSKTDYTVLQPAGGSPLQSSATDSTGMTTPNANTLQVPASAEETLRVLDGEADGAPVNVHESTSTGLSWLLFSLLFALILASAVWLTRRARWAQPVHHRLRRFFATPKS